MEKNELCQVYQLFDIQTMINIRRSAAYNFIKDVYDTGGPFRVLKIGSTYRIPRAGFDAWVNGGNTQAEIVVYDIKQLQNILGIKRTAAYNLVAQAYKDQSLFRVTKIGILYRIPRSGLEQWLNKG